MKRWGWVKLPAVELCAPIAGCGLLVNLRSVVEDDEKG
jgi:hypothetical protein